jgi:hypothetical protein
MRIPSSNLGIRIAAFWADMARRKRRDDDLVGPMAQLVGLAVLACMFIPGVRQMLFSIGIIALAFLGIVVVGLVVFASAGWERRSATCGE